MTSKGNQCGEVLCTYWLDMNTRTIHLDSETREASPGMRQDKMMARVWAILAFAKRIDGSPQQILTTLTEELTEEQMRQSVHTLGESI
jgi:hypothetical protein